MFCTKIENIVSAVWFKNVAIRSFLSHSHTSFRANIMFFTTGTFTFSCKGNRLLFSPLQKVSLYFTIKNLLPQPTEDFLIFYLSFALFSLSALLTTQKLERLIAAAPSIGLSSQPKSGVNTPAATGIHNTL